MTRAVHTKAPHKPITRGNAAMGNIVETYQFGRTTVHICSDSFVKTPEEVERVLDEMHDAGWIIIEKLIERGEEV